MAISSYQSRRVRDAVEAALTDQQAATLVGKVLIVRRDGVVINESLAMRQN